MTDIITVGSIIVLLISCIFIIFDTLGKAKEAGFGTQFVASFVVTFILAYILFYLNLMSMGN